MGKELVKKDNSETKIDLIDLNAKLELMHQDIKRIREKSNQEHLEQVLFNIRKDFTNSTAAYLSDDIESELESRVLKECHLRDTCKPLFKKFLKKNIELIRDESISEEAIKENKARLKKIRKNAPLDICDTCHDQLSSLFEKQIKLMQSIQIYNANISRKQELSPLSEELIVKEVLEPLANKQRLQILQAMASDTKTYSELSKITGMRGGNLLFHLQKLQDNDFILQRNERGDYMITRKGFNLLLILNNIQEILQNSY